MFQKVRISKSKDPVTLRLLKTAKFQFMPRILGSQDPRIIRSQDYQVLGLLDPRIVGSQDCRILGLLDSRIVVSQDCWILGLSDPRIDGSQDCWILGLSGPRIVGSQYCTILRFFILGFLKRYGIVYQYCFCKLFLSDPSSIIWLPLSLTY